MALLLGDLLSAGSVRWRSLWLLVTLLVVQLSTPAVTDTSHCSFSVFQSTEWSSVSNSSFVNITLNQTSDTVILLHEEDPVNVSFIVTRHSGSIGPLCLYLNVTSIDATGDPSNAPTVIGVDGLPVIVYEEFTNSTDDTVEFQFVVELFGSYLGRSVLMVAAQEQRLTAESQVIEVGPFSIIVW